MLKRVLIGLLSGSDAPECPVNQGYAGIGSNPTVTALDPRLDGEIHSDRGFSLTRAPVGRVEKRPSGVNMGVNESATLR